MSNYPKNIVDFICDKYEKCESQSRSIDLIEKVIYSDRFLFVCGKDNINIPNNVKFLHVSGESGNFKTSSIPDSVEYLLLEYKITLITDIIRPNIKILVHNSNMYFSLSYFPNLEVLSCNIRYIDIDKLNNLKKIKILAVQDFHEIPKDIKINNNSIEMIEISVDKSLEFLNNIKKLKILTLSSFYRKYSKTPLLDKNISINLLVLSYSEINKKIIDKNKIKKLIKFGNNFTL